MILGNDIEIKLIMNKKVNILLIILFCFSQKIYSSNCVGDDVTTWNDCIGSIAINGEAYVGTFKNGVPHGKGTYTYSDGATYVGEFLNGKESGKGFLIAGFMVQVI